MELPQYKCHKVVQACRFIGGHFPDSEGKGRLHTTGFGDVVVSEDVFRRFEGKPADGYYVKYEDGYESYSPAEAFEAGYTRRPPSGDHAGCIAAESLRDRIRNDFVYHAPKPGQPETYAYIRNQAKQLALDLTELCPLGRELSTALTKLEEVVFWANASIARSKT